MPVKNITFKTRKVINKMIKRILLIGVALVLLQSLIKAESNVTSSTLDEEDYDEESSGSPDGNSTDHWRNCTFNGTVYFDDECAEWMRSFYIILSFSVAGMILFVLVFLYCAKKFCTRTGDGFERLVTSSQDNVRD